MPQQKTYKLKYCYFFYQIVKNTPKNIVKAQTLNLTLHRFSFKKLGNCSGNVWVKSVNVWALQFQNIIC